MWELQVTSIVLVSAVLASLAVGVLLAYWICVGMFQVFRMHTLQVRGTRTAAKQVRVVEGL